MLGNKISDFGLKLTDLNPGAQLSARDLSQAPLWSLNFCRSNFQGSNLSEAQLWSSWLGQANLTHTNLQRANLRQADFQQADLRHADLTGANVCGANFYEADLRDACLNSVIMDEQTCWVRAKICSETALMLVLSGQLTQAHVDEMEVCDANG